MKIKKLNDFKLNENNLSEDLQDELDAYVEMVDKWAGDNYRQIRELALKFEDLKMILEDYNQWLEDNKESIGEDEIDVTLDNITGLDILHKYTPDELSNLIEKIEGLGL